MPYGVTIEFSETTTSLKDAYFDENNTAHHKYSLKFLQDNPNHYQLFHNFRILFEYLDAQHRMTLINKSSQLGVIERFMGVRSQNEYPIGVAFSFSEMVSHAQIVAYDNTLKKLDVSLEQVIDTTFTKNLTARYNFADNARLSMPNAASSYFEKVRLMAPEFETMLKQFKLFVEDGHIDFELLQISSSPTSIRDIPSLNSNKYIYFNRDHKDMLGCSNLFFSDQSMLTYVDPFKEKSYQNFITLLAHEEVLYSSYQDYQKASLNYLIEKRLIHIDDNGLIKITNEERVTILKDLYENEFASFHRYPANFQTEAAAMAVENIIFFESSLFSKQEQAYFNYFLNKSEFTNGLDLRNSYLHGTQGGPEDISRHEYSYYTYLKLLILAILKIDDDLQIWHHLKTDG